MAGDGPAFATDGTVYVAIGDGEASGTSDTNAVVALEPKTLNVKGLLSTVNTPFTILYALDAATGKELWNSGTTITSFVHGVGPSAGDSQVYVVTHDGTVYAFGIPLER